MPPLSTGPKPFPPARAPLPPHIRHCLLITRLRECRVRRGLVTPNVPLQGTTQTGKALEKGLSFLSDRRSGLTTAVVVITDGFSQDEIVDVALRIRALPNVQVYATAVVDEFKL